jgi:predicted DNA-binding transcriptional regulator AlpA
VELIKFHLITTIITLSLDYGRIQGPCHDYSVAKKIDQNDLVGAHEIAERLGLSFPNVVHTWRKRHKNFPQPVAVLQAGLIWDWKEIQAWVKSTNRNLNS